jgi:hypothetical protein
MSATDRQRVQDIAAAMALKDLASCLEQLEHAEQVLRLASLSEAHR